MIVVKGELQLKPEAREAALAAIRTAVEATRAEPGCAAYVYAIDIDDEHRVHVFEEWVDEDALGTHMAAPYIAELLTVMGGAVTGASLTRYDATGSRPLM